jgi:hypothetical protein
LPADFCNDVQQRAGYQTGALESREDGGHNLLPLLRRDQLSRYARAWTRGESHIARSNQPRCRFLPLAQVCPTAMLARPPHLPPTCAGESSVRIDEHESKDRVKVASPDRERIFWNPRDGCLRMLSVGPTSFPSSGTLRTSVVAGAWDRKEEPCRPNGPTEIFVQTAPREGNRRPEDRDAFHRSRRRVRAKRSLSSMTRDGLSLTPPHVAPNYWGRALDGHCKGRSTVARRLQPSFFASRDGTPL